MKRSVFVLMLLISAYSWSGAQAASPGDDITAIPAGVSVGSSKRQVEANIDDWKDERARTLGFWESLCSQVKVDLMSLRILEMSDLPAFSDGIFKRVKLTASERNQLEAARRRPTKTDVDFVQAQVSWQQLALDVSNRLFSEAIESYHHQARADEAWSDLSREDRCKEYTLRLFRDTTMINGSEQLLYLYTQLDSANTQAIDESVRRQLESRK